MEDESRQAQSGAGTTGGNSSGSGSTGSGNTTNRAAGQALIDDLSTLGAKFAGVVDVAWNSEQRKRAENDLRTGLISVANSLEEGIKRVSETPEAKEFVNTAEDVAGKIRTSKLAGELAAALSQGLRALSEQMDKLAEDIRTKGAAAGNPGSSSGGSGASNTPGSTSSTSADPTRGQDELPQDIPINRIDDL